MFLANVARRGKLFANFIPSHSQYSANSVSIHTNSHPASHSRSPSQSSARSVSIRNVSLRSAAQSRIVPTYNNNSIVENAPIPEGHHESNAESNPSGTNSEAVESLS